MTERDYLTTLARELPEAELRPAVRFLEYLNGVQGDPVLRALADAPLVDEPLSAEDEEALAEAFEDRDAGRIISHEELRRDLLGAS